MAWDCDAASILPSILVFLRPRQKMYAEVIWWTVQQVGPEIRCKSTCRVSAMDWTAVRCPCSNIEDLIAENRVSRSSFARSDAVSKAVYISYTIFPTILIPGLSSTRWRFRRGSECHAHPLWTRIRLCLGLKPTHTNRTRGSPLFSPLDLTLILCKSATTTA